MPTVAETQLAALEAWLASSSKATTTPMGHPLVRGNYATLVSVGLDDSGMDVEALIAQGTLPLFCPQALSVGTDLTPPPNQPAVSDRALHLAWKSTQAKYGAATSEFPALIVVGLATPTTTIRDALTAAGLGSIDLSQRGIIAVPLYAMTLAQVARVAPELPVL